MEQAIENQEPALLPLDAPRVIKLKSKDHLYTWRFRRLTHDDWKKYFLAVVHQTLQVDGKREEVFESETAQLELVDRALVSVEGYGDVTGVKNWKLALPIFHRLAVSVALRAVGVSKSAAEESVLCDLAEVRLDANWSVSGEGGEGESMTQFQGLVHRFRQPSIADLKRFNFECARTRVSGDAENGVTIYPSRLAVGVSIYDDLIDSVGGYSVNGQPLAGVDNIKREMDGAHKAEAALALFLPGERVRLQ